MEASFWTLKKLKEFLSQVLLGDKSILDKFETLSASCVSETEQFLFNVSICLVVLKFEPVANR